MENKGWKLANKGKASEEAGKIRRMDKKRGMTKNGLIVLVCVICLVIGWFYYLTPQEFLKTHKIH